MPIRNLSDTVAAYEAGRFHVQRFYKGANATAGDTRWHDWSFAAGQPAYDARIGVAGTAQGAVERDVGDAGEVAERDRDPRCGQRVVDATGGEGG